MSQLSAIALQDGNVLNAADVNSPVNSIITLLNSGIETDNVGALQITGAKIANNTIAGTKLAMGSDAQGDVLYYNGTDYARLGAGTSGQFLKTQGAAANPIWAGAAFTNSREALFVKQASSATISVAPGSIDVNGNVAKESSTTLTITTAGDWAGGSSLQAVSTTGYVGIDSSGNLKMHTTAPTHDNYGLTTTAGVKRYVSWSSTTYRVIGWFFMNATGSGELNTYGVSNLSDAGVLNTVTFQTGVLATGTTTIPFDDTIPQNTEGDQYMSLGFRPTRTSSVLLIESRWIGSGTSTGKKILALFQDSTAGALASSWRPRASDDSAQLEINHTMTSGTIAYTVFKLRMGASAAGTNSFNGSAAARIHGGVAASYIKITEINV